MGGRPNRQGLGLRETVRAKLVWTVFEKFGGFKPKEEPTGVPHCKHLKTWATKRKKWLTEAGAVLFGRKGGGGHPIFGPTNGDVEGGTTTVTRFVELSPRAGADSKLGTHCGELEDTSLNEGAVHEPT